MSSALVLTRFSFYCECEGWRWGGGSLEGPVTVVRRMIRARTSGPGDGVFT